MAQHGVRRTLRRDSTLLPLFLLNNGISYVVRTRDGERNAVLQSIEKRLLEVDRARVINKLRPFSETRAERYRSDRALALILMAVCVLLLVVTALGIVGLTTYWIAQRRRQIGVRRALGARRVDILRYFQTENLLIAGAGCVLGIGLALGTNLLLVMNFAMPRMGLGYVVLGAAIVLVLGQVAVLWPALRAAAIPPAMATRAS